MLRYLLAVGLALLAASPDSSGRSRESHPRELTGGEVACGWQMFLPAGFEHRIVLRAVAPNQYQLEGPGLNSAGIYTVRKNRLEMVEPVDPRMLGFVWEIRSQHLLTLVEQPENTGADYLGAILFRSADKQGLKGRSENSRASD